MAFFFLLQGGSVHGPYFYITSSLLFSGSALKIKVHENTPAMVGHNAVQGSTFSMLNQHHAMKYDTDQIRSDQITSLPATSG